MKVLMDLMIHLLVVLCLSRRRCLKGYVCMVLVRILGGLVV